MLKIEMWIKNSKPPANIMQKVSLIIFHFKQTFDYLLFDKKNLIK